MTEVYFSFDTEDFTSNHASDAVRDIADLLAQEGVQGTFNVVGYLAREWIRNGRTDVLEALSRHQIGFHSLRHSVHPTICEYTDIGDYSEAHLCLLRLESEGMGMVKAATGVEGFDAAVPPGRSLSYVAMYAYAQMDIPLYLASLFETTDGSGVFYCNGFHTDYNYLLEKLFFDPERNLDALLDEMAGMRRVFIANHPNMILYSVFWDKVNYLRENLSPMHGWKEAPRRNDADIAEFYVRVRAFVRKLKGDQRFAISTTGELAHRVRGAQRRVITRETLPDIFTALRCDFGPVGTPVSASLADVFCAAAHFLHTSEPYSTRPAYGFLSQPSGVTTPVTVSAAGLAKAAAAMDLSGFLPPAVPVDGQMIGPADFLFASLETICLGKDTALVEPKPQQMDISAYPALRDKRLDGVWLHSDAFLDEYLSDRLRLQAWTIRRDNI